MAALTTETYRQWRDITKSDTVNLDGSTYSATATAKAVPCDAIWVGGAGIVAAVQSNGMVANFTCVAGSHLPIRAIRVNSTNTTATLLLALYQS